MFRKIFIFIIISFVILSPMYSFASSSENNNYQSLNQQLIELLKQSIALLMQQVAQLQEQLLLQQKSENNISSYKDVDTSLSSNNNNTDNNQEPYFVVSFSPDKQSIKNDGNDYAVVTIKTMLSNGKVASYKNVSINGEPYASNKDGIIIYKTETTTEHCGSDSQYLKIVIEDENKSYTEKINIDNVWNVKCDIGVEA